MIQYIDLLNESKCEIVNFLHVMKADDDQVVGWGQDLGGLANFDTLDQLFDRLDWTDVDDDEVMEKREMLEDLAVKLSLIA
ncbi:hypothetical protein [Corynebacterium accolens]|uniref:hypothetical protein n=1 Tax=Corynebacterium accolens TaxID=38284 RepID=UPI00266EBA8F|nr:hypothetical protein [Corynebacterium accolens]WKS54914.1 hypothetical protein NLL31_06695 [Corynebacterium accolens]